MLNPIDFAALYRQQMAEKQKQTEEKEKKN